MSLVSPPVAYEPARVGLFREFLAARVTPVMRGCATAVEQERAQGGKKRALSA